MSSFVGISSVFKAETDRNLEFLAGCYGIDTLLSYIRPLIHRFIPEESVSGKKVLLKPNWVKHCTNPDDDLCLCTHPNFILAVVRVLLEWKPSSILIGDAPIQGCDWSRLLPPEFLSEISDLSLKHNIPIAIKDFRKVTFNQETNNLKRSANSDEDYIIFNVGKESRLEEITGDDNRFRVTCYDPDRLAESHHKGVHKYCIARDVFDSDVVITLPKIKTHQKAGLTNSLKILVGINGDKDYLPHHRIGATECGGDCYKGKHPLRRASELILDEANRRRGKRFYHLLSYLSAGLWRLSRPSAEQNLAAGWYGNDTVWRMVLDINLIAEYGLQDGTLSKTRQRKLYTICDGIVGGQGNGPLSPLPLPLGIIGISDDAAAMDELAGHLFRLNIDRVPLLKAARDINSTKQIEYYINGVRSQLNDADRFSTDVILPPGWINYEKQ